MPPKTSDMAKIRMMAKAPSKNLRSPLPAAPPKFGGGSAIFEVEFVFFDQKEGIFHPVYTVLSWPVTLIFFGQSKRATRKQAKKKVIVLKHQFLVFI